MTVEYGIIGDVHGNISALRGLLRRLVEWRGILIFTGDYVNRGPDSFEVIQTLVNLANDRPDTVFLAGNHDIVFRDAIRSGSLSVLLRMGGAPTVKSYVETPGIDVAQQLRESIPADHLTFLSSLRASYISADGLAVTHGPADHLPGSANSRYHIYGHVPNIDLLPRIGATSAGIDTGCGTLKSGRLTCLFWPSLTAIQVDAFGGNVTS
ncbi:metallophosphoesterase [Nocardia sp. NPDC055049]